MTEIQLSPPNYLKFAFKDQHNLLLLLGAFAFSLAFATPLPLLAGAGIELLWLSIGPRLPAFRGWVDAQLSTQYLAKAESAIQGALRELPETSAERFSTLSDKTEELVARARPRLSARELSLSEHGLLELRRTFLDYSFLSLRLETLRDPTPAADLEKEAAQLRESYAAERELTARMTIRQSLSSVQKRISQQSGLISVERDIELRLEMLDMTVSQLQARLADPGFVLSQEIDNALAEVGSAESLELTVDEIFDGPAPSIAA